MRGVASNYGEVLRVLRRSDEAIAAFRRAVELQPQAAEFHFNLGNAFLQNRRRDEALAEFEEALLRLEPGLAQAHFEWASGLMESSRLDAAVAALHRALHFDPAHCGKRCMRSVMRFPGRGGLPEALEAYRRALRPLASTECGIATQQLWQ